jgi:hypothetical protein
MNLLTNRIIFIKTGLLLLVILFFLGCKKQKNKIGFDDANHLPSGTYFTDTITVKSEIVLVSDSISTTNVSNGSGASYLLVGAYQDPYLGNISAEAYTQLQLSTQFVELPAATADSAYIYLNYTYHYGNPNIAQTLNVYQLTDTIGGIHYTNFSNSPGISHYTSPASILGSVTFNATTDSANYLTIKIKSTNPVGMAYIQSILNGSKNNTDFVAQFPGIAILPANNTDGAILQINGGTTDSSAFRIFYTQYGVHKTYDLNYNNNCRKFYRVLSDRTGKNIMSLSNHYDSISTSSTSNECYIQACSGLRVRLSFPYLHKLREAHSNIAIMSGQLVLTASPYSDTTDFRTNTGLLLMKTGNNMIKKTTSGTTTGIINYVQPDDVNQLGNTSALLSYPSAGVYTFNMRSYIQAVLLGQIPNNPVIVSPYPLQLYVDRLVFNDNKNPVSPLKLNLYYTTGK